jgi:superfamily II DNA or RNA helicase
VPVVIHANWSQGRLHLWMEDGARLHVSPQMSPRHPFAVLPGDIGSHSTVCVPLDSRYPDGIASLNAVLGMHPIERGLLTLRLPTRGSRPIPSTTLAAAMALTSEEEDSTSDLILAPWEVPTLIWSPPHAAEVAVALDDACGDLAGMDQSERILAGASLVWYARLYRLARALLAQQRFVPMLAQRGTEISASWDPWVSDSAMSQRVAALVAAMPPVARAAVDSARHDPSAITLSCLGAYVDAACREALARENFFDSVEGRPAESDLGVAWLQALLGPHSTLTDGIDRQDLVRRVRGWVAALEERGPSAQWRLLLRLVEPLALAPADADPDPEDTAWTLTLHMQSVDRSVIVLDAPDIYLLPGESATIMGRRIDRPQELLLAELARATRICPRLETALENARPASLRLTTREAYEFLREYRPLLLEQGFGVEVPAWWDSPQARLGVRLRLDPLPIDSNTRAPGGTAPAGRTQVGLTVLVGYQWEIAVGDITLSLSEFEQIAARRTSLLRLGGRWVEVRPEDVQAVIRFIRENPGGQMPLADAMRMAYASDLAGAGIPVVGMEAGGWLEAFLNSEAAVRQLQPVEASPSFRGMLRPYQQRGLAWLVFQETLGFGVCLADDMGLGKTVQLLALLAYERDHVPADERMPTLLLVPMSVVGNWIHETQRFCPDLTIYVHHGPGRATGDDFLRRTREADLVITTYALAARDHDLLEQQQWGRIVLDEAQCIKNPATRQSQAARALSARRRIALTGTPVENRLAELWSIMDFLNPGYLGSPGSFRAHFAVPIERLRDRRKAEQLKALIRPFVLRRLKSDPTIIADLPEKVESREYVHLTGEQASLYETYVRRTLGEVEEAEGMQRRGLVLAALVRLKQICNHPALLLGDPTGRAAADVSRSGKCLRLLEMLDEVLAEGDQALVFTQFREMGVLLEGMIRRQFGRDVLFLHGGTTQPQRQAIIDRFQKADGSAPVLILSLRAGGVGLNLTAANHVFHFDRWWNPAVENQATDRAYRIGQTRTVQVHKFVVRGTLEERIDQMIESKTALAEQIIGAGEAWLSELSTDQLRDILTLRNDAVDDDE